MTALVTRHGVYCGVHYGLEDAGMQHGTQGTHGQGIEAGDASHLDVREMLVTLQCPQHIL